jgi:hypothetical protein
VSYRALPTYEVKFYVGSREQYDGRTFGKRRVLDAIAEFQKQDGNMACVRVTECDFQAGDYLEGGFEVALIDYPRYPKGKKWVLFYMRRLADHLLVSLNQNRIGIVDPVQTNVLEQEGAADEPANIKRGHWQRDESFVDC